MIVLSATVLVSRNQNGVSSAVGIIPKKSAQFMITTFTSGPGKPNVLAELFVSKTGVGKHEDRILLRFELDGYLRFGAVGRFAYQSMRTVSGFSHDCIRIAMGQSCGKGRHSDQSGVVPPQSPDGDSRRGALMRHIVRNRGCLDDKEYALWVFKTVEARTPEDISDISLAFTRYLSDGQVS